MVIGCSSRQSAVAAERLHDFGQPLWVASSENAPAKRPIVGCNSYDVVVVGAGLFGLSTAYHLSLSSSTSRIAVLESDHLGAGGSGRGTGLVGPRVGPLVQVARKRFGDEVARELFEWSVDATRALMELCWSEGIECTLVAGSQLVTAADNAEAEVLEREFDAMQALGLGQYVELVRTKDSGGSPSRYRAGMRYTPAATIDPAALLRGLANAAQANRVRIYEQSRVLSVNRSSSGYTLTTPRGLIRAKRVVMAVNGMDSSPIKRRDVIGMTVQAAATEPIHSHLFDELNVPLSQPIIGLGRLSPYFRTTSDRRLIVGGGLVARGTGRNDLRPDIAFLRSALEFLHPGLTGVSFSHVWSGPIAQTVDSLPVIGQRKEDGLFAASGWCGHGLAASTYAGKGLATLMSESTNVDNSSSPLNIGEAALFPIPRPAGRCIPRTRFVESGLDLYLRILTRKATVELLGRSG